MYLYLENKFFISLKEVELIIDYNDFFKNKDNNRILKYKNLIDISKKEKRTLIFTKKNVYISSYTNRALNMRINEYSKLVNSIVF